jgi:catechol 2,3-dioxygenase-like lactoylglutathione lyase family enzyme
MGPHLFAGVRVRDYQASRPWYDRLFGEPSFLPHDTEAVWTVADDRSVYIVEHPDGAGHSVLLLFLDDLDAWVAEVADRGLEPTERETYANGVRKAIYRDPDGNSVEFGGAPVEGGE